MRTFHSFHSIQSLRSLSIDGIVRWEDCEDCEDGDDCEDYGDGEDGEDIGLDSDCGDDYYAAVWSFAPAVDGVFAFDRDDGHFFHDSASIKTC